MSRHEFSRMSSNFTNPLQYKVDKRNEWTRIFTNEVEFSLICFNTKLIKEMSGHEFSRMSSNFH